MGLLDSVFGWTTVGVAVPLIVAFGWVAVSIPNPQFNVAQSAFCVAAIILSLRVGLWISVEHGLQSFPRLAAFISFFIFGIIGATWIAGLQWVDGLRPQQKSDTQLSPDLRISIAGMQVFTDVSGLTGFVLTVQVMNMGPVPTTAVGWSMTIITPDGKEWKEPPTNPPETLTMASTSRGTTVLKKEDFALESLTHKPLKKSDPAIKSMILFYFLADMNYLMNPLSKIELSAEDYAGRRYTDTELMGDFSGPPQSLPPVAGVVLKNVISTPFKPAQRTKISLSLHVDSTEFPIPVKVFTYTVVAPVFGHDKAKEEIISTTLWRELDSVRPFEDSLTSSDSDGIVIPSAPIPQDVYTDIVEGKKALYFLVKVLDKQNRDIYEFWGFMPRPEIAFVRECPPRRRVPTLR